MRIKSKVKNDEKEIVELIFGILHSYANQHKPLRVKLTQKAV